MFGLIVAAGTPGCGGDTRLAGAAGTSNTQSVFTIFGPPPPAVAAAWAVDPYDADKRYRGTLLLANAPFGGESVYLELYRGAVSDGDPAVRAAAIRGLALHGAPSDVERIVPNLAAEDRLLRWESARALQRLHEASAVPALLRAIDEKNEAEPLVRSAAATALSQYPEPRVLDGLISALGDRDLTVNQAALAALRTLTGQDLGLNIRAWVAWRGETRDAFAGRQPFVYPVFYRDRRLLEWVLPFWRPPNEIASTPEGMDVARAQDPSGNSTEGEGGSVRNN